VIPARLPSLICCRDPNRPPMGRCGQGSGVEEGLKIKWWEKVTLIRKISDFIPKGCDLRYKNT